MGWGAEVGVLASRPMSCSQLRRSAAQEVGLLRSISGAVWTLPAGACRGVYTTRNFRRVRDSAVSFRMMAVSPSATRNWSAR
jgi:hypothetical protein